jgi:hypothetical protein
MGKAQIRANVKWFSERQKPRGKSKGTSSPRQKITFRLNDLAALYRSRCGITLSNDDAGIDYLEIALHHLARLPHPQHRINCWIEIWTPWLTVGDKARILPPILMNPRIWTADELAHELGLTMEERTMLGITTIGAVDMNKAQRAKQRKHREKLRMRRHRAKAGAVPRAQYEAKSINRAKPWLDEGISRATWYRRQRATGIGNETPHETTPRTP